MVLVVRKAKRGDDGEEEEEAISTMKSIRPRGIWNSHFDDYYSLLHVEAVVAEVGVQ